MKKVNLILQYLSYKIFGRHSKGHGIHSPFVFDFILSVLNKDYRNTEMYETEKYRKKVVSIKDLIRVYDFGAGSKKFRSDTRIAGKAVKAGSIKPRFGRLLYRMVQHYRPETIIELGTLAGIGTMYLAKAAPLVPVYTIEGDPFFSELARTSFKNRGLKNISVINDTFENALPELLAKHKHERILMYIDGNHRKKYVLDYFEQFCENVNENSILIVDDIRWSDEMHEAWNSIRYDRRVSVTIDLFFMGVVFFRKNIKKQNFLIKF